MEINKDHDLLIEIKTKLDRVIVDVADIKTNLANRVDAIEKDYVTRAEYKDINTSLVWLRNMAITGMAILGCIQFYFQFLFHK